MFFYLENIEAEEVGVQTAHWEFHPETFTFIRSDGETLWLSLIMLYEKNGLCAENVTGVEKSYCWWT